MVRDVLEDCADNGQELTLDEVLEKAGLMYDQYEAALSVSKTGWTVILKRQVSEQFINCYAPSVLRAWQANMDCQYIVDAYACLMHVASYILKAEKGMSEILKKAAKEVEDESMQLQLRKLGATFMTHRDVSAQEAVYRALSLPLQIASWKVIFVNTSPLQARVRHLLPQSHLADKEDDDENVLCMNMID